MHLSSVNSLHFFKLPSESYKPERSMELIRVNHMQRKHPTSKTFCFSSPRQKLHYIAGDNRPQPTHTSKVSKVFASVASKLKGLAFKPPPGSTRLERLLCCIVSFKFRVRVGVRMSMLNPKDKLLHFRTCPSLCSANKSAGWGAREQKFRPRAKAFKAITSKMQQGSNKWQLQ